MRAFMRRLAALAATAFVAAIIAFCVPAQTAQAQGMGGMGGRGHHQPDAAKSDNKTIKADDKAYKDALKRIPEKKVDPWGTMR
jgi:opacity protein-like surface antigen